MSSSHFSPPNSITRGTQGQPSPDALVSGPAPMGLYEAVDPVLGNGDMYPLRVDVNGKLLTSGAGGTPLPPSPAASSRAVINFNAAGDNTIIAAPAAGNCIRIFHLNYKVRAATVITLKDGAAAISGPYNFAIGEGQAYDAPGGIYPLTLGDAAAFVINSTNAVEVDGFVQYTVDAV